MIRPCRNGVTRKDLWMFDLQIRLYVSSVTPLQIPVDMARETIHLEDSK